VVRDDIDAVIEPIVEAARMPSRRRRDDLRRELRSHFEDSGQTPPALADALARFGDVGRVGESLRSVYRRDYVLLYLVKVGFCIAAAVTAAILIEAAASVRFERDADMWRLAPGFTHSAAVGAVLTLAMVAAAEATRVPFAWPRALWSLVGYAAVAGCASSLITDSAGAFVTAGILAAIYAGVARAARGWKSRALLGLAAFGAAEYLLHESLGIRFGPIRALAAGAILLTLSAATIAIVAFSDRTFVSAFRDR